MKIKYILPLLILLISLLTINIQASANESYKFTSIKKIYDLYFSLKNDYVNDNNKESINHAKEMQAAIKAILLVDLDSSIRKEYKKVKKILDINLKNILESKDIKNQRKAFKKISDGLYILLGVYDYTSTVYLQFCPMANGGKGASWLSKGEEIRNPYFGSRMLKCGRIKETIK
jgi:hypothetical protein